MNDHEKTFFEKYKAWNKKVFEGFKPSIYNGVIFMAFVSTFTVLTIGYDARVSTINESYQALHNAHKVLLEKSKGLVSPQIVKIDTITSRHSSLYFYGGMVEFEIFTFRRRDSVTNAEIKSIVIYDEKRIHFDIVLNYTPDSTNIFSPIREGGGGSYVLNVGEIFDFMIGTDMYSLRFDLSHPEVYHNKFGTGYIEQNNSIIATIFKLNPIYRPPSTWDKN